MEDRAVRTWGRTVKFYDNLKFVYQIQTTLREWQQQDEEPAGAEQRGKPRERRPQAAGQLQSGKRTSSTRRHASSGPSGRFTLRDTL